MQLKKDENGEHEILHSLFVFLRSKKILILTVLIIFLVGGFAGGIIGMAAGDLFFPANNPAKKLAGEITDIFGISPWTTRSGLSDAFKENYKIPINYINGLTSNPERIVIDIKNNDFQKLAYKREMALANGLLVTSEDDYVPAKIHYNDQTIDVKLRLKGDASDHFKGNKWSFRIKTKGDDTLFGMKVFSIQDPVTRDYVGEWLFHTILKNNGIVALRYNFIDVTINGKHNGIYAIEEHFDKRLIEHNEYREGSIIRFNENLAWLYTLREGNDANEHPYISSEIDAFQTSNIIDDPNKFEEYTKAKDLLESFRNGKLKTSDVFDVDKLAKYIAITDMMGAPDGFNWADCRFYYNPITSKLEPIGYDANAGVVLNQLRFESDHNRPFVQMIFQDPIFLKMYVKELERFSQSSYLDNLFIELHDDLQSNISILHKDVPYYHFSKDAYYKNQKFIQNKLNPIKGLHGYFYNNITNGTIILEVGNIQAMPIEVLNVAYQGTEIFEPKNEMNILYGKVLSEPVQYERIEFVLPEGFTWSDQYISDLKLNYRILGHSRLRNESVFPWSHLSDDFLENDFIRQNPNVGQFDFLAVDEDSKMIVIRPGSWVLNNSLIIPSGYTVMYSGAAPTHLDIRNNATILSYSPLQLFGSEEHPLTITSSDSTGQGIAVLNAGNGSILKWVTISNLSAPSKNGWKLTGAVTFYESPIVIENCYLSDNKAGDDLLNIVRSEFEISNSLFKNSLSDALDVDFGKGIISHSVFIGSGNDAMDFSGSVVNVTGVTVNGTGDKAVSCGEASKINIDQVKFKDCNIAIASKDQSVLNVDGVTISACNVGFTAYQKKSEFGPASILAYSVDMLDVATPHIIEFDSSLWIDDKEIADKQKDVYARLYAE